MVPLGIAALGTVVVIQGMGLDFGALAVLFGALGVGVGFGLQDLTRNLSSGLTLLMEGKLKVGDLIEFGSTTGTIRFGAGEFFGELPLLLLLQVPYPTTMIAAEDTTLFVVPGGSFRALLASRPAFADTVAREVARRSDVLRSYEDCLRQRGLLDDADLGHPLQWFRERLRRVLKGPAPQPPDQEIQAPGPDRPPQSRVEA